MIIKASAKINLALDILSKREDGYHEIDMVTFPLELHDCLEITELSTAGESFITSDDVTLLCDESNLVTQAFNLLKERFAFKRSYRIEIYKSIPIQAGLAGGSADAAALIKALLKDKKLNLSQEEVISLAIQVGADVPYCLFNKPARVKGIGENIELINTKINMGVLLVKPKQGLSTKEVYELSDCLANKRADIDGLIASLISNCDEKTLSKYLYNGLRPAATKLCPDIEMILEQLKSLGLIACEMSGSGSSCFALSKDMKKLQQSAKFFNKLGYKTILTNFAV